MDNVEKKDQWKIKSIRLDTAPSWQDKKGLQGVASFECGSTRTDIDLSCVQIERIMEACAESIVSEAQAKVELFHKQAQALAGNLLDNKQ